MTVKIRVGFVMHKMQVAGAEVLVRQIIETLGDQIDATVICLDAIGQIGHQMIAAGHRVVCLDRRPGMDLSVARRLDRLVGRRGIEVLHAHQYTPFFYAAVARLQHRTPVKIIFTEHGRHYPDVVSARRRWANRLVLSRAADVTTACCDFSTHALRRVEGFAAAETLPNGIDIEAQPPRGDAAAVATRRQRLGLDPDRVYVACVARMHPVKDHATLVRAWATVHRQRPMARLLLVGDGQLRSELERLVADLSGGDATLADSIQWWGVRDDVDQILRAVDVFALTSVSEAASLTLLEAMAAQCAAVVTDVGGNAEHLRNNVDGYLVPRGDDRALGDRLIDLIDDPRRRAAMGTTARQRVVTQFQLSDAVDQYLGLYQRLAGRKPPAGRTPPAAPKRPKTPAGSVGMRRNDTQRLSA